MAEQRLYRFGPLERHGLIFGLTGGQLGVGLGGVFLTLVDMHIFSTVPASLLAVLILTLSGGIAFMGMNGRALYEWIPVMAKWMVRKNRGETTVASRAHLAGQSIRTRQSIEGPGALAGLTIISAQLPTGEFGVIKDSYSNTYTAVVSVRGRSFALLDHEEKRRLLSQWADVLAGVGREGSPITRVQWIERTLPETGDTVAQYMREAVALPRNSPAVQSYLELISEAGPVSQQHEAFIALQVDAMRARRSLRTTNLVGDEGPCIVLGREISGFASRLQSAELDVLGVLTPRILGQVIRVAYDPESRHALARQSLVSPEIAGVAPHNAWPLVCDTAWTHMRSDSAFNATYWCAEWPRIEVGPDFLAPLLLQTWAQRTVSVTMEVVSPIKAQRDVEAARTANITDEEMRNKAGFVTTVRRQREQENVVRREQELADGHTDVRFSGYVTVTADSEDELELACAEVEQQASQSRLVLRRLLGEQDVAFTYTLPLCRGLK